MADNMVMLPTASEQRRELPTAQGQTRYTMETEDGTLVWVPEDKLEAWKKADHEAPLNRAEQQVLDKMLERTFRKRA